MGKHLIPLIVCIAIVGGVFAYDQYQVVQRAGSDTEQQAQAELPLVKVQALATGELQRRLRFSGRTRTAQRAQLTFLVDGQMRRRLVNLGDHVKKGQLLAVLHNPQLAPTAAAASARIKELDARLQQAVRDQTRAEQLHAGGAATDAEMEQARSQVQSLQAARANALAQRRQANQLLTESELRAPFTGVIEQVHAEPGEYVRPGQAVLELSGAKALEIEVQVPENTIVSLGLGDKVDVEFPFLQGHQQRGEIVRLGSGGQQAGRLFPVVVSVPYQQPLRPGLTAEVLVQVVEQQDLLAPLQAVVDPGVTRPRVYLLQGDKVKTVEVKVGQVVGDQIAIAAKSGDLKVGDKVVTAGQSKLIDGQAVQVVQ